MASKRTQAKEAVWAYLKEERITSPYELRGDWREDRVHEILEGLGYANPGTRRCIINEVFRDKGTAPNRDSFRRKTYRFEDHTLLASMTGTDILETLSERTLNRILEEICNCLDIKKPKLELTEIRGPSVASGSHRITLSGTMHNRFTLIHEVTHIYGSATKDFHNHCSKFLACEMALLDFYRYKTLDQMFELARDSKVKVDEDYGRKIKRKLEGKE